MQNHNISIEQQLANQFNIGLEDNDVVLNVDIERPVDEDGVPLDTTDAPEAEIVEAQAEEAEIVETEDKLENLQGAEESLEGIRQSIARFSANGGMNQEHATLVHNHIEDVGRRVGINLGTVLPSLENYGGTDNAWSTTVSLENKITESLKAFWKTIVTTVEKLWTKLKDWFVKMTNVGTKLHKRAVALKKVLSETKGEAKEKEIKSGAASYAPDSGTIAQAMTNVVNLATAVLGKSEYDRFIANASVGTIKATEVLEAGGKLDANGIKRVFVQYAGAVTKTAVKGPVAGLTYYRGGSLLGGKAFVLPGVANIDKVALTGDVKDSNMLDRFIASTGEMEKVVRQFKADVVKVSTKEVKSVPVASLSELNTIVDGAIQAAKVVESYKTNYAARDAATKAITDEAKKHVNAAKEAEQKNVTAIKANAKLALVIWQAVGNTERVVLSTVVSQVKTGLDYVNACIKQYGGEAEKSGDGSDEAK